MTPDSGSNPAWPAPAAGGDAASCAWPALRLSSSQQEALKYLALALMLFDHVAWAADAGQLWHLPGRMVFPVFAFLIAWNYHHHSRRPAAYMLRLGGFAVISQPFYMWFFDTTWYNLNIMATLLSGLVLVVTLDSARSLRPWARWPLGLFAVTAMAALSFFQSYTLFGPLSVAAFWWFIRKPGVLSAYVLACIILGLNYLWSPVLGIAGLLALPAILLATRLDIALPRIPKMVGYWFYPLHLGALKIAL